MIFANYSFFILFEKIPLHTEKNFELSGMVSGEKCAHNPHILELTRIAVALESLQNLQNINFKNIDSKGEKLKAGN